MSTTQRRLIALVLATLVAAGLVTWRTSGHDGTRVTAYFTTAEGLYEGDDVRVLGVRVGRVVDVAPEGSRVKVVLEVDDQPLPTDANAAIVSPSLVSGRYVQLSPPWTVGPTLADGATLDEDRTAVPVSFDEVKRQLTQLATALGPDGPVGRTGVLDSAIRTADANLGEGRAAQLRQVVTELRRASGTLSTGSDDLLDTITHLDSFTRNLAVYDASVRGFTTDLASGSELLGDNRVRLTDAVRELRAALRTLGTFARHHGDRLGRGVEHAAELSAVLAGKAQTIADILHVAPHSIAGLTNVVEDQALTGRVALANLDSTAELVCGAILGVGGTSETCQDSLGPMLGLLGLGAVPGAGSR